MRHGNVLVGRQDIWTGMVAVSRPALKPPETSEIGMRPKRPARWGRTTGVDGSVGGEAWELGSPLTQPEAIQWSNRLRFETRDGTVCRGKDSGPIENSRFDDERSSAIQAQVDATVRLRESRHHNGCTSVRGYGSPPTLFFFQIGKCRRLPLALVPVADQPLPRQDMATVRLLSKVAFGINARTPWYGTVEEQEPKLCYCDPILEGAVQRSRPRSTHGTVPRTYTHTHKDTRTLRGTDR